MPNDTESRVLDSISLEEPWNLVETFARMPRWMPEDVDRAALEIVARLRRLRIPHDVYEPELYLSIPLSGSVEAGGRTLRAKPPSMSRPVPDGLTGELAYMGANAESLRAYSPNPRDFFGDGADGLADRIRGRILLTEGFGNPALTAIAERCGAVGLVVVNPGEKVHWGTCTAVWGTPTPEDRPSQPGIPVLAVNRPDGRSLVRLAENGGRVTMRSELVEGWFSQKIPVARVAAESEGCGPEFLLLHGHYDSWDVGVGDNATGNAALLEVARVLHAHRRLLRRSVRVAWWPGHSTGRYAGSAWYADAFAGEIDRHCVASVNCDSPGCRWATSYHKTTCMAEMKEHVAGVVREITGQSPGWIRPKRAGDHSFYGIGLPTYFSLTSTMPEALRAEKNYYEVSGCGGNIAWHTEDDRLEIADPAILETDIRIYALAVLRHACAPVLPDDWRATASEFADTLRRYDEAAGESFDLSPALDALQAFAASLEKFHLALDRGALEANRANAAKMRLARLLVPINFSRRARFRQDAAVVCPPLPDLAPAAELDRLPPAERESARIQLLRGRNRLVAALKEARRIALEALA